MFNMLTYDISVLISKYSLVWQKLRWTKFLNRPLAVEIFQSGQLDQ